MGSIDTIRFIGFIAVVLLHTAASEQYAPPDDGKIVNLLCRFAVPFFFMASGYFLGLKSDTSTAALMSARRVFILFAVWLALYISITLRQIPSVLDFNYFKWMVLTGGPAYHLWFLSSLTTCLLTIAIADRLSLGRFLLPVGLALYICGLCLDEFKNLLFPSLKTFDVRVGPMFGLLFVALGMQVCRRKLRFPTSTCLSLIVLGVLLQFFEATSLYLWGLRGFANDVEYYVGTVPFAFGVFMLAVQAERGLLYVSQWGQFTLGLYCVHLALIWALDLELPHATFLQNLIVAAVTIVLSLVIVSYAVRFKAVRPLLR